MLAHQHRSYTGVPMPTTLAQTCPTTLSSLSPDLAAVGLFSLLGLTITAPCCHTFRTKRSACCSLPSADVARTGSTVSGTRGGLTAWKFIKFNISSHFAKNGILPVQLNAAACHSLHLQMRSSDWSRHLVDHYSPRSHKHRTHRTWTGRKALSQAAQSKRL